MLFSFLNCSIKIPDPIWHRSIDPPLPIFLGDIMAWPLILKITAKMSPPGLSGLITRWSLIGLGYVCLAVRDIFHEVNPKAVLRGMISKAIVVGLDPLTYGGYH